jgi:hypothetical protein
VKTSKPRSAVSNLHALAPVALACAIAVLSPNAYATVHDAPAFAQRLAEFIETTRKRIQEYTDAIATMNHYKQQVSELGGMLSLSNLSLAPHPMENASVRPLDQGMGRCDKDSTSSGLDLMSLITSLMPLDGNYAKEQHDLCRRIVLLENYKHNDLVQAMKDLKKLKEQGHYEVVQKANTAGTQSKNATSKVAAINTLTAVQIQRANIEYTKILYDEMIAALNEQMKNKANEALNGKKKSVIESIASAAVSSGVLYGALNGQKTPCPSGFTC